MNLFFHEKKSFPLNLSSHYFFHRLLTNVFPEGKQARLMLDNPSNIQIISFSFVTPGFPKSYEK